MNGNVLDTKFLVSLQLILIAMLFLLTPIDAFSQSKKDPKCRFRNLETGRIDKYRCDRFQSKGERDSITPQVKIIEPLDGESILASDLVDIIDDNNAVVGKALPIKIVVNPEFVVDFTQASSAVTEYLFLPQEDGIGHLHSYVAPLIGVETDEDGNILNVDFVGNANRADMNGGFCVFRNAEPESTPDYQVLNVECPLQSFDSMGDGEYKVTVDFTENSHGPRMKNHPRDVPPGDQIVIDFMNDL